MKKRMLITSIVMVVVLAVALTTSSLAWFSAEQAQVTANTGRFVAASVTGSNVNIAISTDMMSYKGNVTLGQFDAGQALQPAALRLATENASAATLGELLAKTYEGGTITVGEALDTDPDKNLMFDSCKISDIHFMPDTITSEGLKLDPKSTQGAAIANDQGISNGLAYYDALYVRNNDASVDVSGLQFGISGKVTQTDTKDDPAKICLILRVSYIDNEHATWTYAGYKLFVLDTTDGTVTVGDIPTSLADAGAYTDAALVSNVVNNANLGAILATLTEDTEDATKFNFSVTESNESQVNVKIKANKVGTVKVDVIGWFDGNNLDATTDGTSIELNITVKGIK